MLPDLAVEVCGKKGPVTLTRYVLGFELLEEDLDGLMQRGRLTTTGDSARPSGRRNLGCTPSACTRTRAASCS